MNHNIISALILIFSIQSFAADDFKVFNKKVGNVVIPFVHNTRTAEIYYSMKADFAEIEKMAPLSPELLKSLKPQDLRNLTMEEFNQLYARLGSGPMPLGDYDEYLLQKTPIYGAVKARLVEKVKGAKFIGSVIKLFCQANADDCIYEKLFKGKRFSKKNDIDQVKVQGTINFVAAGFKHIPQFITKVAPIEATLDFAEGLIDKTNWTLFPMNAYCGISPTDTRRESIITDAAWGDEFGFPSYIGFRDSLVTRKGLNLSEEYRMVRPGLYIGKVYTNKLFLFNVAIEKTGVFISQETKNECADGTKTR